MSQRKLLIATGVVGFFLFAIAQVPARVITGVVPQSVVTMSGLSGTLWQGNVQTVTVAGFQLRDASWTLHPLALLIGRLSLTLDSKWGDGYARGDVSVGATGSISLRDVQMAGPLGPVLKRMNLGGSGGELAVDVAAADIEAQWPTRLIGTVRVGRLPLSMIGVSGQAFGNYALEFDIEEVSADGAIPGVLSDDGGPLEMLGELRLVPPRDYVIQARLKARADAPPDLARGLLLVGPKLPDGSHEFQMTGSL